MFLISKAHLDSICNDKKGEKEKKTFLDNLSSEECKKVKELGERGLRFSPTTGELLNCDDQVIEGTSILNLIQNSPLQHPPLQELPPQEEAQLQEGAHQEEPDQVQHHPEEDLLLQEPTQELPEQEVRQEAPKKRGRKPKDPSGQEEEPKKRGRKPKDPTQQGEPKKRGRKPKLSSQQQDSGKNSGSNPHPSAFPSWRRAYDLRRARAIKRLRKN